MPTYTLKHKKTGKEITKFMSISEMIQYEKDHPEFEVQCGTPGIGYNFNRQKPNDGFRDRLREIKKSYPRNTIDVP